MSQKKFQESQKTRIYQLDNLKGTEKGTGIDATLV